MLCPQHYLVCVHGGRMFVVLAGYYVKVSDPSTLRWKKGSGFLE